VPACDDCKFTSAAEERAAGDDERHALPTGRRKLKVNEAKSAVTPTRTRKFLGFSFSYNQNLSRRIARSPGCAASRKFGNGRDGHEESVWNQAEGTGGLLKGRESYFGYVRHLGYCRNWIS